MEILYLTTSILIIIAGIGLPVLPKIFPKDSLVAQISLVLSLIATYIITYVKERNRFLEKIMTYTQRL